MEKRSAKSYRHCRQRRRDRARKLISSLSRNRSPGFTRRPSGPGYAGRGIRTQRRHSLADLESGRHVCPREVRQRDDQLVPRGAPQREPPRLSERVRGCHRARDRHLRASSRFGRTTGFRFNSKPAWASMTPSTAGTLARPEGRTGSRRPGVAPRVRPPRTARRVARRRCARRRRRLDLGEVNPAKRVAGSPARRDRVT